MFVTWFAEGVITSLPPTPIFCHRVQGRVSTVYATVVVVVRQEDRVVILIVTNNDVVGMIVVMTMKGSESGRGRGRRSRLLLCRMKIGR